MKFTAEAIMTKQISTYFTAEYAGLSCKGLGLVWKIRRVGYGGI